MADCLLSIVTVVHSNLPGLVKLYEAIKYVLSEDIEWIVKDSGCCEKTKLWALQFNSKCHIRFSFDADDGIYDALNFAVGMAKGEYYLTVGSDDVVFTEGVYFFLKHYFFLSQFDVIAFPVNVDGKIKQRSRYVPHWISTGGLIASHSVGTVIRKDLHYRYGYYDITFKILADCLFITRCVNNGANFFYFDSIVFGQFDSKGVSSVPSTNRFLEAFRYQVSLKSNVLLQVFLFLFRCVKYFFRISPVKILKIIFVFFLISFFIKYSSLL